MGQSLDGPSFCLSSELWNSFNGCFVPNSKKGQSVHTLVFVLLEFHAFSKLYILGILSFWANIHLSVSTYHVSSFVIGLPHSEWCPPGRDILWVVYYNFSYRNADWDFVVTARMVELWSWWCSVGTMPVSLSLILYSCPKGQDDSFNILLCLSSIQEG